MSRHLLAVCFVLAACNGGDKDDDPFDFDSIPGGTLSGVIGGEDWEFVAGTTNDFLSDESSFFTDFYAAEADCASFGSPEGNLLITRLAADPGEYELGSDTLTFFIEETFDNLVTTSGGIRIDEVTDSEIKGALSAEYNEENSVGGEFTISICADDTTY